MAVRVSLTGRTRRARVYLVAPAGGDQAARAAVYGPAFDALIALGYDVVVSGGVHEVTERLDDLLACVDFDLLTLAHSDYVVVMPGAERHFEAILAPSLSLPVLCLAEVAELTSAA